jgi:hypothetical protein
MRFIIYPILFAIFFVAYVRFLEKRTVFMPQTGKDARNPSDINMAYEDVSIKTSDGLRLHGWFVPAKENPTQAVTFLYFHGNAGNIYNRVDEVELLHDVGGNVLIIDYRGYGISEGSPSEKGIYLDALATFDYVITRKDVAKDRIIAYGVSLGGAAAAELALNRPVAGLVLHSTFTSASDMAKKIFPIVPSFLIQTKMDTINKVQKITVPKLIIHAPQDEVAPYWMGKRLFDASAEPKEFLELQGQHNDAHIFSRDVYMKGTRKFLGKYF